MVEIQKHAGLSAYDIHMKMQAIRKGKSGAARGITFSEFSKKELKGVDPEKVLYDLGVNLERMNVDNVMALDQSAHYIVPEVFIEAITKGFTATPWYAQLLMGEESLASKTVNAPYIEIDSGSAPSETGEGATIKEADITYGDRDVTIRKLARKITLTYEAIRLHKLTFVSRFLEQFGTRLGQSMNARTVERLVNGDQADGSMAPAIIGVASTIDGITYADIVRVLIRMGMLGYPIDCILADEDGINTLLNLEEFKKKSEGSPLINAKLMTPKPEDLLFVAHSGVGANKFLFGCSQSMALQGTVFPLEVESEKIISKQIENTVASITTDVINVERPARVLLDQSITYAANGFPAWMAAE
jgi:HK97 family phage major capsid protein